MKSIRSRLTLHLLGGFALLWLAGGTAIYLSYRAGLLAGVEAELQSLSRQVRATRAVGPRGGGPGRGGPRSGAERPGGDDFGDGVYWQVWPLGGGEAVRSANLDTDLPRFDAAHGGSLARVLELPGGVRVMASGSRYGMARGAEGGGRRGAGGRSGAVEITVAKDLAGVDRKLLRLSGVLALSGLVVAALAVAWVSFVVRDGLAPLRRIADEVGRVDADSLGGRFSDGDLPAELQPIVQRLNQLMGRLEEGFTRERKFSSDLAHEMRTPIAELRILAESALKWPEDRGPGQWSDVVGSIGRMEAVVQAMLQLARIEQADAEWSEDPLPLARSVDDAWSGHAARADERQVSLQNQVDPGLGVAGDRGLWGHLLGNLLGNAAEYADRGSEVMVQAGRPDRGEPILTVANRASSLAADDIDHLFDRFWRGDRARSDAGHCGLGLPLARACAEAMGMRLEARRGDPGQLEMRVLPGDAASGTGA